MRIRSSICLITTLVLCLLCGCSRSADGKAFRYDIAGPVVNLDPQYATDPSAVTIIQNTCEGLVVLSDGEIALGAAESFEISADELTYTFHLREDLLWSDGETPLTAYDFAYGLSRLFQPGAVSPHAKGFAAIESAASVMRNEKSILGISAPDEHTLIIQLEHTDPLFLERLTTSAAMPCNQKFFDSCRGRYGLELQYLLGSGPFSVSVWNNERYIQLDANPHYQSEVPATAGEIILYIGRENIQEQFLDGKADIAPVSWSEAQRLEAEGHNVLSFDRTTWCIVFNTEDAFWQNPLLRQGLASTIQRDHLNAQLPAVFTSTRSLIPPSMLLGGASFGNPTDTSQNFQPENGSRLFQMGLDALGLDTTPALTFLVPDSDDHYLLMGEIQQDWQQHLSLYLEIQRLPAEELESRRASGDFQMMLMPFTPATNQVESLLGVFTSDSQYNYFAYQSPLFDQALAEAGEQQTLEGMQAHYRQAHSLLLSDAVVIPLYTEATCYALAKGVNGLEINPFGSKVYFKYASKS